MVKKAKIEQPRKHRQFFVNGKLEFSFYFDPAIKDKEQIVAEFLKCKDFKYMADYCGWKVKKTSISEDLMRVDIEVKDK